MAFLIHMYGYLSLFYISLPVTCLFIAHIQLHMNYATIMQSNRPSDETAESTSSFTFRQ